MSESKKFRKLTDRQHVLKNPGMYIGTMDPHKREYHILSANGKRMLKRKLKIVPGFIQIFQELLSNAVDHEQEDPAGLTQIKVDINQDTGYISVMNNGRGIPVVMHEEENQYIPEMVFGEFKTSSHFGAEKRKAGGKHGIGAKATNVFSKVFTVETVSQKYHSKFKQTFSENLTKKTKPKITKISKSTKDYTKVTYLPDFEKFGLKGIDKAHFDIMKRRVYEAAATTGKKVSVYFNGDKIPIKDFADYIKLYGADRPMVEFQCNADWDIGMMLKENDDGFEQVSFVNGIPTIDGGTHVDYIAKQISSRISELVKKKLKTKKIIRDNYILNNIELFVRARIFDPDFPSQNKYVLSTNPKKFGTSCEIPDKIIDKFAKMGLIERITNLLKFKEESELKKQSGRKTTKLRGIPKLDDAEFAGGKNSQKCVLVLTEGDSAKTLAIEGRGSVPNGNDYIGAFPLRGKLKNVRLLKTAQAVKNKEIVNIVKILGLKYGVEYTDTSSLRYGKIIIFTDADVDGTHIKGLLINFIGYFWPSLLQIKGFITSLATPIVKAFRRSGSKVLESHEFYSMSDYDKWLEKIGDKELSRWEIKYYKGLGTSSKQEAKEYFHNYLDKLVNYQATSEKDFNALSLAFDKEKADQRKKWVNEYDPSYVLDQSKKQVSISSFINKDLIHFSTYDNARSIPNVIDGLKPSQRKIIHTCFLLNLVFPKEMKVARLSGAVGERTGYHHGEVSLQQAIIKLAQNFVGANNINTLYPSGQFGSRLLGGHDASAARYIYTALSEITPHIFNKLDFPLLNYVDEDGLKAEPYYFVPVIPMVLVNGAKGIGTGYSTTIPSFNPKDIIKNLIKKMKKQPMEEMSPWYRGFTGQIIKLNKSDYLCKGKYEIINDKTLKITELPIELWYETFAAQLDKLEANKYIKYYSRKDYDDRPSEFIVVFPDAKTLKTLTAKNVSKHVNQLEDKFNLTTSLKLTNMHLFNKDGVITKYKTPNDILEEFYDTRLDFYKKRRQYLLEKIKHEMSILKMKVQFINDVIDGKIKINNVKWTNVVTQLEKRDYIKFSKYDLDLSNDEQEDQMSPKSYEYLKRMPIYSVTTEEKERLENLLKNKQEQHDVLMKTSPKKMWHTDLKSVMSKLE